MTSLDALSPELLEAITAQVELEDLIRLLRISGNKNLTRKCLQLGGVQALNVRTAQSKVLLAQSWHYLALFPRLTRLCVGRESAIVYEEPMRQSLIWTLDLPPTMLEIEIHCRCPLYLFIAPVPRGKRGFSSLKFDGYMPQCLRERFPNLHTLWLHGSEYESLAAWTPAERRYFVDNLPASLTSLLLPFCSYSNEPLSILPATRVVQNLAVWRIDKLSKPLSDLLLPYTDAYPTSWTSNAESQGRRSGSATPTEILQALSNLHSLHLSDVWYNSSFDSLRYLTNLRDLHATFSSSCPPNTEHSFSLPPKLTRLTVRFQAHNPEFVASTLAQLPHLTYLVIIAIAFPRSEVPFRLAIPPTVVHFAVRSLYVGIGDASPLVFVFPPSDSPPLYALELPKKKDGLFVEGEVGTRLQVLSIPSLRRLAFPIPSTLTSLDVSTVHCPPEKLLLLPKTLRRFSGVIRLLRIHANSLAALKSWSADSLKECIRQRVIPQVPPDSFEVTFSLKSILKNLLRDKAFEEYKPENRTDLSLATQPGQLFMPPSLQVLRTDELVSNIKVESLPPGLTELCVVNGRWLLPKERKQRRNRVMKLHLQTPLDKACTMPEFQLPPNLTKLAISPRVINAQRMANARMDLEWHGIDTYYPLLATAPLLHTLILRLPSKGASNSIVHLPPTITDLTVSIKQAAYLDPVVFPSIYRDWLPNLAHFRAPNMEVLYHEWQHRIDRLRTFSVHTVTVRCADMANRPAELRPDQETLKDRTALTRFIYQNAFPSHLRDFDVNLLMKM